MWSQHAIYQSLYTPWFAWSLWLTQFVYKVNMRNLIVTFHNFVNAPKRMWRPSVWICSWLLGCVGGFLFLPFFLNFYLLSFLLYFIWQGMQNMSAWRSWYGKLQKVMNFTAPISLIPTFCSSGQLHPCAFSDGNGSKTWTVLHLTCCYVTFIHLFCLSSAHDIENWI